ncbi:hypothetical protein D1007_51552 [Hordeum vulgare]|nr:hypothetical protein D1007_51552 [Hordeum vulgare]
MPSTRVLIVAVILAAVASVQGHATAPAPSAVGQCTAEYISELRHCVDFRLGRVDLRNLANERKRCCRNPERLREAESHGVPVRRLQACPRRH